MRRRREVRCDCQDVIPPGDDVVPVPLPVNEVPPQDSFCDLVFTGGVTSGVVYPWAIVELARAFRFRNIGGTSAGAMAAALAAAAEYGRRTGFLAPFEALRRAPADLACLMPDGRTRMLSLFQSNPRGRRLIWLWGKLFRGNAGRADPNCGCPGCGDAASADLESRCPRRGGMQRAMLLVAWAYRGWLLYGAFIGALLAVGVTQVGEQTRVNASLASILFIALVAVLGSAAAGMMAMWCDIRQGLIENEYGLCKGASVQDPDTPDSSKGLSDWLHEGIQASAGLKTTDPPLTFHDLWTAPAYPGAQRLPCGQDDPESRRSINLQMITTNLSHGRPYRLPLPDPTSRLFFRREELEGYLPPRVLDALVKSSQPYAHVQAGEPQANSWTEGLLELPGAKLPVVVAARLSLSLPLLLSAVPLWAIDFESPPHARVFRRCLFTDGALSSNFPIHLFDAAVPRWPTFGLWLGERRPPPYCWSAGGAGGTSGGSNGGRDEFVCLPRFNAQGWRDLWNRFDPLSRPIQPPDTPPENILAHCPEPPPQSSRQHLGQLFGFFSAIYTSAAEWRDRTSFALPQVRNRVARILLLPDEGGVNIGMPPDQVLEMAHRYGTLAGRKFVAAFASRAGRPTQAWSEQRWIRFNVFLDGLRERLSNLSMYADWCAGTTSLRDAIAQAVRIGPVRERGCRDDGEHASGRCSCHRISLQQAQELGRQLEALERLGVELQGAATAFEAKPKPELRLRPPL